MRAWLPQSSEPGAFSMGGSDSRARVPNRFAIWASALKMSSFLAAGACSSSRISPVRQFLARTPDTYCLPRRAIQPSTTAALPVRSQISDATSGVSFASGALDHQAQCLADARIRKHAEVGRLSELHSHDLARRSIERRISRGIGEISENNRDLACRPGLRRSIGVHKRPGSSLQGAVPKTAALCLRRNLRTRYRPLGGDANTGRCSRCL